MYDTAVIGGGIMGCTTALHLARSGMRVVVVDRRGLGMEASGVNAGTLAIQIKRAALVPYALRGRELWASTGEWLGADVGYRILGGVSVAFTAREAEMLEVRMAARIDAGAPIEIVDPEQARNIEPGLSGHPVLAAYCPLDGYANSSITGQVFHSALLGAGVEIRERSPVQGIERMGGVFSLSMAGETILARRVVVACGVWFNDILRFFDLDLPVKYRVNQIAVTERTAPIMRTIIGVATGLLTLKQSSNGTVLIGGGWQGIGDPRRGGVGIIPENLVGNLRLAHYTIPALAQTRVVRTWLGMEAHVPDFMPLVGPLPGVENVFVIGCVRGGFTIGPFMGMLLAQHILGREPEMPLFDPARLMQERAEAVVAPREKEEQ